MILKFTLPAFIIPLFYGVLSFMDLFSLVSVWMLSNPNMYTLLVSALYQFLLLWFFSRSEKGTHEIDLFSVRAIMAWVYLYTILYVFPVFMYHTICNIYVNNAIELRSFSSVIVMLLLALISSRADCMPKKSHKLNLNVNTTTTQPVPSTSTARPPDVAVALADIGRTLFSTTVGAGVGLVSYRACRRAIPFNAAVPVAQVTALSVAASAQVHIHKHLPPAENLAPLVRAGFFDNIHPVQVIPPAPSVVGPNRLKVNPEEGEGSLTDINPVPVLPKALSGVGPGRLEITAYSDLDLGLRNSNSLSPNFKKVFSQLKADASPKVTEVYNNGPEGIVSIWEAFT